MKVWRNITGVPISEMRAERKFPLLVPSLSGLRRYAHLISVEYFGDLLAVMQRVAAAPGLPVRIRMHTLLTAADILKCGPWLAMGLSFALQQSLSYTSACPCNYLGSSIMNLSAS